jgi:hypothetical protein
MDMAPFCFAPKSPALLRRSGYAKAKKGTFALNPFRGKGAKNIGLIMN